MYYRITNYKSFTNELDGVKFIDGVSQEHLSSNFVKRLRGIGYEMVEIPDPPCKRCQELEEELLKLKTSLKIAKEMKKKTNGEKT